jgi:hypothetical protein
MSFKIPNRATPLTVVQSAPINENLQVIEDIINDNLNMSAKINASDKGIPNGVATLDSSGKSATSQIPSSIVTHVFTVKSLYQQLSLSDANIGDICIVICKCREVHQDGYNQSAMYLNVDKILKPLTKTKLVVKDYRGMPTEFAVEEPITEWNELSRIN